MNPYIIQSFHKATLIELSPRYRHEIDILNDRRKSSLITSNTDKLQLHKSEQGVGLIDYIDCIHTPDADMSIWSLHAVI